MDKENVPIAPNNGGEQVIPWFKKVRPGQLLSPIPFWNEDASDLNKMKVPTKVLEVKEAVSQSGILFKVQTVKGISQWLDAGWFEQPVEH